MGELIDKLTILEIKRTRIKDLQKRRNIQNEIESLAPIVEESKLMDTASLMGLKARLSGVNEQLWEIEDAIRGHERRQDFGPEFVQLARAVYRTNDLRAELKQEINLLMGSSLVEEKSYAVY
ncbi:hypothetical protein [Synechococcus sp. CS-1332]|uniref:hypothetical protein n=1 Tax=Synechococcus sp. CS-1332 TaxID=2847972 RepID=UPI00223A9BDF|nr:hypothetical protein [Synechococcus sp. CS-1332]